MNQHPQQEETRPNAPKWLKVLVCLHILAITIWAMPVPSAVMKGERAPIYTEWVLVENQRYLKTFQPLQVYLFSTGFWQYWDMFSPNPSQTDYWCDADVTYKDGLVKRYQYPRIFNLSLAHKFVSERYRKFYERVNNPDYRFIWAPFAQRIALLNDDPKNPPVKIALRNHWKQVMPPGMRQPQGYNEKLFYTYIVDQAQLARDRKGLW
jgi:hypothetical protein